MPAPTRRKVDLIAALALAAGNLLVIWPYLISDFSSRPWNNDYIYIAEARVFRDFPWTWNALQYAGVPFAYVYPPLFHVLTLLMPVHSLGHAFHLASGLGYALVPAALYVLALQLFGSRLVAGFVAVAYSILPSPVCLLFSGWVPPVESLRHGPWGFVTLMSYAEAPHTLALALILFAVAAAWRGRWVIASVLAAMVFLLSMPGIIGLLIVLAALAAGRSHDLGRMEAARQALGIAGIGYGVSAFWMTPGFFHATDLLSRVILRHELAWPPWSVAAWLIVAAGAAVIVAGLHRRVPANVSFLLVLIAIPGAAMVALAATGSQVLPMTHRYLLELNAGLVLALGWCLWAAGRWRIPAAAALLVLGLLVGRPFLSAIWSLQDRGIDPRGTVAFQISDWLARHAGSSRVFASGELNGSLNLWSNVPQIGGTHNGISNFLVVAAEKEISGGCSDPATAARVAELWLRALDVHYAVVHGAASYEHFHWFTQPDRFASFPVAWTNDAGDTIYRLPPPESRPAVVVNLAAMTRLPPLRSTHDLEFLEAYNAWVGSGRTAAVRWNRPDSAVVDAALRPGEAVLVKVNYDAGWSVGEGTAERDPIGFLLLRAPPGHQLIGLRFGAAWDVWLGRGITFLTIVLLLLRVRPHWIGAAAIAAAAVAFAILVYQEPSTLRVAEATFQNVRSPLINPGGIVDGATYAQPPLKRGSIMSIWGKNFGGPRDLARLWIAGREARIDSRQPAVITAELPGDTPATAEVSVEVNGCRGNSFVIPTH
jgi:xanthosine utilization system XapX-like protein